jgi:predicted RNA-binding Zn ribbon-like protein
MATSVSGYRYLDGNQIRLRVNFVLMETRHVADIDFMGGHPALDFVDTVGGMLDEPPRPEDEFLRTYGDLLDFGLKSGTLSERLARRLERLARERSDEADAALAAALRTRSLLEAAFRPISQGEDPPPGALDALGDFGAMAMARGQLVAVDGGFDWSWENAQDLEAPLWPIAHAALELITSGPLERLKNCGRCRWLFLDTTKNRSRRWCSMEGCGTDAKIERYVARRRERRAESPTG